MKHLRKHTFEKIISISRLRGVMKMGVKSTAIIKIKFAFTSLGSGDEAKRVFHCDAYSEQ